MLPGTVDILTCRLFHFASIFVLPAPVLSFRSAQSACAPHGDYPCRVLSDRYRFSEELTPRLSPPNAEVCLLVKGSRMYDIGGGGWSERCKATDADGASEPSATVHRLAPSILCERSARVSRTYPLPPSHDPSVGGEPKCHPSGWHQVANIKAAGDC